MMNNDLWEAIDGLYVPLARKRYQEGLSFEEEAALAAITAVQTALNDADNYEEVSSGECTWRDILVRQVDAWAYRGERIEELARHAQDWQKPIDEWVQEQFLVETSSPNGRSSSPLPDAIKYGDADGFCERALTFFAAGKAAAEQCLSLYREKEGESRD